VGSHRSRPGTLFSTSCGHADADRWRLGTCPGPLYPATRNCDASGGGGLVSYVGSCGNASRSHGDWWKHSERTGSGCGSDSSALQCAAATTGRYVHPVWRATGLH
jgi:hypothetical protein